MQNMLALYKVIGYLFASAAIGSALAMVIAKESVNRKIALGFCALFLVGAFACLALAGGL